MITDLDVRIADALFDAASSTTTRDDAFNAILRRAESGRTRVAGRRITLVAASATVAAAGVTGLVVLRPGHGEAPGSAEVPITESVGEVTSPTTLPTAGIVSGPLVYDDATLLSMLYTGFDVGEAADQSRMIGSVADNEVLGRCMNSAGFDHVGAPSRAETAATDPRYVLPPADFAAQYGFGVSAEALGILPSEYAVAESNVDRYDALSQSQQEAYQTAYSDCLQEQVDSGEHVITDQSWVAAHDYAWEQFEPIVRSDDRVVDALAAWRECMTASGLDYENPESIPGTFQERLAGYAMPGVPVDPGTSEYAEIEQLMADEIAVATANAPCVEPYTATLREVILDGFDEYKSIFSAALEAGVESDAVGFSS